MNEVKLELASRGARLGGAILDSLIMMVAIVPIMLIMGAMQAAFSGIPMTLAQQAILFVIGAVVFLAFNGYLLLKRGQTVGKVVMKTRIVDLNGNLPDFGKLLLMRYLVLSLVSQVPILGGIVGLVNALMIFGQDRRCLHDHLAGTKVVNV